MEDSKKSEQTRLEKKYVDTLTEKEKQAYEIAKDHLGMSFQLDKSIGFIEWKNEKNAN
jgi:hypothetical protein|tara:strand:- start:82 stop:255 length:174 start_codon:yes stop_codon:yes gene_type:complete